MPENQSAVARTSKSTADAYTREVPELRSAQVEGLGQLGGDHPSAYLPDKGLVAAVNVALVLGRPLLLTGAPGTGKSQLAYSLAWQLAARRWRGVSSARVEKFETKSTTVSRDLFYGYDLLGRFHAVQAKEAAGPQDFITFQALGSALLNALPRGAIPLPMPTSFEYRGPTRTVVLVDEVDKAPRDFPNDLLNEVDHMYFRVPELGNVVVGGTEQLSEDLKPILVITSNSERSLPDPFLRRCIYYDIPFPDEERLREILLARLPDLGRGQLIEDALRFFFFLRQNRSARRQISPAELIQWLTYLLRKDARFDQPLREVRDLALAGLAALTKEREEQNAAPEQLETFLRRGGSVADEP